MFQYLKKQISQQFKHSHGGSVDLQFAPAVKHYIGRPELSGGKKWYPVIKVINYRTVSNFQTLEYFETHNEAGEYLEGIKDNDEI